MLRDMNKTRDKKRIRAVIFDMDGVISDTQNIHSAIESELLKGYGVTINPEEITRKYAGTRMKEWMPDVFKHHHVSTPSMEEISAKKKVHLENALKEGIREVPGTREFIQFLKEKNIPIAVASASRLALIDLILSALGLREEFDAVASSEEVKNGKPEPDVFLLAAERLNVPPSDSLVIEDGISGMVAAKKAGMRCVALVRGSNEDKQDNYPANLVVSDLRETVCHDFLF